MVTVCIEPVAIACVFVWPRLSVSVRVPATSDNALMLMRVWGAGEKVKVLEVTFEPKKMWFVLSTYQGPSQRHWLVPKSMP